MLPLLQDQACGAKLSEVEREGAIGDAERVSDGARGETIRHVQIASALELNTRDAQICLLSPCAASAAAATFSTLSGTICC